MRQHASAQHAQQRGAQTQAANEIAVEGSIYGIARSIGDDQSRHLSAAATLSYWFNDSFSVGAGFRYIDGKIEYEGSLLNEEVQLRYSGPFVKASVGF